MVSMFVASFAWFALLGAVFSALAKLRPSHPGQPLVRAGLHIDVVYWFFGPLVFSALHLAYLGAAGEILFGGDPAAMASYLGEGLFGLRDAPFWAQVVGALVVTDVLQYWTHRAFHAAPLWRFHAIHHGPEHVDWLTCVRFHPVNTAVHSTGVGALVVLMGFDPLVFAVLAPFNVVYSGMVHANVDWDFGPLRYVFASPAFHRWHHARDIDARDKNFAPTFPVLDLMFGTFHMPKGRKPESFGVVEDPVPERFGAQLIYPFLRSAPRPAAEAC